MAKYYPRKQTITIAIICILAVGFASAYAFINTKNPKSQTISIDSSGTNGSTTTINNTDWKNQFLNISSSSDTTLGSNSNKTSELDSPTTLTDKLSRDFFARYIQLKQNSLDNNPQLVQDTIDETLANTQSSATSTKTYSENDITILTDSSNASIHSYANAVGDIFIKYGPTQNPVNIAYSAFDKNDMSLLAQIDPITSSLQKILSLLLVTPVPQNLSQNHLDLINGVSSMVYVSQGLRNIEGDPMQSMVSLSIYDTAQTKSMTALSNIKDYLQTNKITFTPSEPGLLFSSLTFQ